MMKKIFIFVLGVCITSYAFADFQTENEELARINSVLNAVYPLIDAAQKAAPKNRRVTFHYDWLRKDIQSIQAGISQKINQAAIEPRAIKPLKQTYVQLNTKESAAR